MCSDFLAENTSRAAALKTDCSRSRRDLSQAVKQVPKVDMLLVMGDFDFGSRTAKEQNRTELVDPVLLDFCRVGYSLFTTASQDIGREERRRKLMSYFVSSQTHNLKGLFTA